MKEILLQKNACGLSICSLPAPAPLSLLGKQTASQLPIREVLSSQIVHVVMRSAVFANCESGRRACSNGLHVDMYSTVDATVSWPMQSM